MPTPARHLAPVNTPWQANDPVLAALRAARARRDQADRDIRILLAYARELATPRPYRLADLADATGKSISGIRTAYTRDRRRRRPAHRAGPQHALTTPLSAPGTVAMTYAARCAELPVRCQQALDTETAIPGRRERPVRRVPPPRHPRLQPPRRAGDIEAITTMATLADHLEDATRQAITGLREFGYSWADIAMRLGITRQGAQQRWGDTPPAVTDTSSIPAPREPPVTRTTGPVLALAPGTRTAPGTGANTGPRIPITTYPRAPPVRRTRIRRAALTPDTTPGSITSGPPPPAPAPSGCAATSSTSTRPPASCCAPSPRSACPTASIYKPCGNRRATTCPGCAETYRRDAYHLIRAGLIGGKGITPDVATHPAVFVTFTAPSFGPVHARPVRQHTCTDKTRCRCQPQPCHARRDADHLRARPSRRLLHPAHPR